MIERLKKQQDKLLVSERHEAWETVARKLAHEIKNPLTPIQLSIDRLREKYSSKLRNDSIEYEKYLETINRQIKDIEGLVNEFSNFARMPKPIFKKINILKVITDCIEFIRMSSKNEIIIQNKNNTHKLMISGDAEQLNRVFINLIKNSEEAFLDIIKKDLSFKGKIYIEIESNKDYIMVRLIDNGTGITDTKKVMTPYFTTKVKGSGLGLPVVNKIISEHSGDFIIRNNLNGQGTTVEVSFPKTK